VLCEHGRQKKSTGVEAGCICEHAGRRVITRSLEAAVYVSMAGRKSQCKESGDSSICMNMAGKKHQCKMRRQQYM
jgi:hypothetical protein